VRKLFRYFFLFIILLLVFSFTAGGFFWRQNLQPVDSAEKEAMLFVVPKGWGVSKIAQQLEQEGLIKNSLVFKILARVEGLEGELQAGDFRLSPAMSPKQILNQLTHGSVDIWVTIPEGLRKEEIGLKIKQAFKSMDQDFDAQGFVDQAATREGYLFPDTYLFPKGASPARVINIMTNNFKKKTADLERHTYLSQDQIVILASLIEREAKFPQDRYLVSGVLLNRLKEGWPLQVDATVQYVRATRECSGSRLEDCNWWPASLTNQDLEMDSPYNTYKNKGLPPAPICNPGLASLKAAVDPKETDYWYYLSEPSGETHFSKTNEEHNQKIEKYLN
jgi:UPF0755 protein